MKTKLLLLLCFIYNIGFSQETSVPDANFEAYLETHDSDGVNVGLGGTGAMGNGILNDGKVTTANISSVINLDISGLSISYMTGIEGFTDLEYLDCSDNTFDQNYQFTVPNTKLITLICSNNDINNQVIDGTSLEYLDMSSCDLSNLNINNYSSLTTLILAGNSLTNLSFNGLSSLVNLDLSSTGYENITSINGVNNLTHLNISNNSYDDLDLSSLTVLDYLDVSGTGLNTFITSGTPGSGELKLFKEYTEFTYFKSDDYEIGLGVDNTYLNSLTISIVDNQIRVNSNEVEIQVYNFLGTRVKNENLQGVYIVRIVDKNNRIRVEKLFI